MKNEAVSPVIGVLLMLTLTLIIAAIVNSYAGGLMETETKSPSATIQAKYSKINGMEIQHISGDSIPVSSIKIFIRPSETMGRNAGQYTSEIDKKFITDYTGSSSWNSGITSLKPGDVFYILNNSPTYNLTHIQDGIPIDYWINSTNPSNTFYLELSYKNTIISRNEVLIEG